MKRNPLRNPFWLKASLPLLGASLLASAALAGTPAPAADLATLQAERDLLLSAVQDYQTGELPEIVLGRLPESLNLQLPAGSRVLGTLGSPEARHAAMRVFFELPQGADLAALLREAGYTPIAQERAGEGQNDGFLTTQHMSEVMWYSQASGLSAALITQRPLPEGGQAVSLWLQAMSPEEVQQHSRGFGFLLPLPKLAPPSGAAVHLGGSGGGSDMRQQSARITGVTAAAAQEHYLSELQRLGYRLLGSAGNDGWWVSQHSGEGGLLTLAFKQGEREVQATLMLLR